jgi:hypothetical protein
VGTNIESEKPVCTLTFGGAAAFSSAITEAARHLSAQEDMLSIKVNDIVKEQRKNVISGLFLASFWLISSSGYYQAQNRQELLEVLTAFLLLNDGYQNNNSCDNSDKFCDFSVKMPWGLDSASLTFVTERQDRCPNLPEGQIVRKLLSAKDRSHHFQYTSLPFWNTYLPFQNFFLVSSNGNKSVRLDDPCNEFKVMEFIWEQVKPWLILNGLSTLKLDDVKYTDPTITRSIIEYVAPNSSPTISALGLSVPIFYFPLVLGALLLANTTVLVGNWVALRDAVAQPPDDEYGWLILYVGRGFPELICRICIIILFLSVLAVPIVAIWITTKHLITDHWHYYGYEIFFGLGLAVDFPVVWIFVLLTSILSFTVALCGTARVQLRLRAAIAREKQYRQEGPS